MYESFFGLTTDPFRLTPEHSFCFDHRHFSRAKAYIDYALLRGEGFVVVTGQPGTGKTMLATDLVARMGNRDAKVAMLTSTQMGATDLLRMAAYSFGLAVGQPHKAGVLQAIMGFLAQQRRLGRRVLLIVDEAQDLPVRALEELRLLANLQQDGSPLIQMVLLGQESFRDLVRSDELEQLHQRVVAAWHLGPLDANETIAYVRHRLECAGWQGDPAFEPGVLRIVFTFSQGVPRRINLVCSRLLLRGFSEERHIITEQDANCVFAELNEEELGPRRLEPHDTLPAGGTDWAEIDHGLYSASLDSMGLEEVMDDAAEVSEDDHDRATMRVDSIGGKTESAAQAASPMSRVAPSEEALATFSDRQDALLDDEPHSPLADPNNAGKPRAPGVAGTRHGYTDEMVRGSPDRGSLWLAFIGLGSLALLGGLLYLAVPERRQPFVELYAQWTAERSQIPATETSPRADGGEKASPPNALASAKGPPDTPGESDKAKGSPAPNPDGDSTMTAIRGLKQPADAQPKVAPEDPVPLGAAPSPAFEDLEQGRSLLAESAPGVAPEEDEAGVRRAGETPENGADIHAKSEPSEQPEPSPMPEALAELDDSAIGESAMIEPKAPSPAPPVPPGHAHLDKEGALDGTVVATRPDSQDLPVSGEGGPATSPTVTTCRVLFDWDSITVGARYQADLDEIIVALRESGGHAVDIIGFTDRYGDPDYNRALSRRRAEAVADYLAAGGIERGRLRIEGRGARAPDDPADEAGLRQVDAEDRMVKVVVRPADNGR